LETSRTMPVPKQSRRDFTRQIMGSSPPPTARASKGGPPPGRRDADAGQEPIPAPQRQAAATPRAPNSRGLAAGADDGGADDVIVDLGTLIRRGDPHEAVATDNRDHAQDHALPPAEAEGSESAADGDELDAHNLALLRELNLPLHDWTDSDAEQNSGVASYPIGDDDEDPDEDGDPDEDELELDVPLLDDDLSEYDIDKIFSQGVPVADEESPHEKPPAAKAGKGALASASVEVEPAEMVVPSVPASGLDAVAEGVDLDSARQLLTLRQVGRSRRGAATATEPTNGPTTPPEAPATAATALSTRADPTTPTSGSGSEVAAGGEELNTGPSQKPDGKNDLMTALQDRLAREQAGTVVLSLDELKDLGLAHRARARDTINRVLMPWLATTTIDGWSLAWTDGALQCVRSGQDFRKRRPASPPARPPKVVVVAQDGHPQPSTGSTIGSPAVEELRQEQPAPGAAPAPPSDAHDQRLPNEAETTGAGRDGAVENAILPPVLHHEEHHEEALADIPSGPVPAPVVSANAPDRDDSSTRSDTTEADPSASATSLANSMTSHPDLVADLVAMLGRTVAAEIDSRHDTLEGRIEQMVGSLLAKHDALLQLLQQSAAQPSASSARDAPAAQGQEHGGDDAFEENDVDEPLLLETEGQNSWIDNIRQPDRALPSLLVLAFGMLLVIAIPIAAWVTTVATPIAVGLVYLLGRRDSSGQLPVAAALAAALALLYSAERYRAEHLEATLTSLAHALGAN
jgi:hypothetical protein